MRHDYSNEYQALGYVMACFIGAGLVFVTFLALVGCVAKNIDGGQTPTRYQKQAVQSGAATWVDGEDGSPKLKWINPPKSPSGKT